MTDKNKLKSEIEKTEKEIEELEKLTEMELKEIGNYQYATPKFPIKDNKLWTESYEKLLELKAYLRGLKFQEDLK